MFPMKVKVKFGERGTKHVRSGRGLVIVPVRQIHSRGKGVFYAKMNFWWRVEVQ